MAVSHSWFQNWQAPANLLTERQPFNGIDNLRFFEERDEKHRYNSDSSPNLLNFYTYLLSMGILTAKTEENYYDELSYQPQPLEETGPFKTWYRWKQIDFQYESKYHRNRAILEEEFIPENTLPLGIDLHKGRLFVTFPKWKKGIPCTLAVLPKVPKEESPLFSPYPNWDWHDSVSGGCDGLISVFRVQVDSCDRIWILDSGQVNISKTPEQICPPKLVLFDLNTDQILLRYEIPKSLVKQDGLFSNILVDIRDGDCINVHAYLADVWRFGLVVFSLKTMRSWRVTDHLFYPDPFAAAYQLHDLTFEWTDGIFSLALSPEIPGIEERLLYFHPMSSFREFYVKTSILCNETGWMFSKNGFKVLGESRGKQGHASSSGMDKNGVLFYNLVSRDSIGCWDSRKPYKRSNLGVLAKSNTTLVFPNDLKVDREDRPSIWIITNRLPYFLYRSLNKNAYNFRIMSGFIDEAITGTVCDPNVASYEMNENKEDEEDCYCEFNL